MFEKCERRCPIATEIEQDLELAAPKVVVMNQPDSYSDAFLDEIVARETKEREEREAWAAFVAKVRDAVLLPAATATVLTAQQMMGGRITKSEPVRAHGHESADFSYEIGTQGKHQQTGTLRLEFKVTGAVTADPADAQYDLAAEVTAFWRGQSTRAAMNGRPLSGGKPGQPIIDNMELHELYKGLLQKCYDLTKGR